MWIVRLALRRPYTMAVLAILIFILGALAIVRTPTDIFPNINIPVVSIIWSYNGLTPDDMSDRIVSITERALTTTVDNIQHVESQSLYGIAVIKVFLQPTANIQQGIAQITAISQTQLRQLPVGTTPPLILAYSASSVPVLQLALSGQNLSEQELNDYGLNTIRTQLITVPGASVPYPYGGKQRQVQVDLNTAALQSKGLSALDVVNAICLNGVAQAMEGILQLLGNLAKGHQFSASGLHVGSFSPRQSAGTEEAGWSVTTNVFAVFRYLSMN